MLKINTTCTGFLSHLALCRVGDLPKVRCSLDECVARRGPCNLLDVDGVSAHRHQFSLSCIWGRRGRPRWGPLVHPHGDSAKEGEAPGWTCPSPVRRRRHPQGDGAAEASTCPGEVRTSVCVCVWWATTLRTVLWQRKLGRS